MGRRRNFSREDVLTKAIPVFWKRGFADTKVEDLEEATGVNKSGLYSEFSSKEEIFVESLKHYLKQLDASVLQVAKHQKVSQEVLPSREGRRLFCDLLDQRIVDYS